MMRTLAWQFDLSGIDVDRAIRMERVTVPHLHIGLRLPGGPGKRLQKDLARRAEHWPTGDIRCSGRLRTVRPDGGS